MLYLAVVPGRTNIGVFLHVMEYFKKNYEGEVDIAKRQWFSALMTVGQGTDPWK